MIFKEFVLDEKNYKIIPITWMPDRIYKIFLEGWPKLTLDFNDKTLNELLLFASKTMNAFIDVYKDTHAFTQPIFGFKPDTVYFLEIGIMENKEYERRNNLLKYQ